LLPLLVLLDGLEKENEQKNERTLSYADVESQHRI